MTTTSPIQAAPAELLDAATRKPQFGTYVGSLPAVDFDATGAALPAVITRGKRWMYVMITSDELICCAAIIRTGYGSNAFAFVLDRKQGSLLADVTATGPAFVATINHHAGEGADAKFGLGPKQFRIDRPRGSKNYFVNVRGPRLKIEARLSTSASPQPLSVISDLATGRFSTTEKGALLEAEGVIVAGSRKFHLKGAWASYDYTAGMLERRTAWKWAFGMGRANDGKPIAFNLTEGFVGQRECVAWYDDKIIPLGSARFLFDRGRALEPWRIQTDKLDTDFNPTGVHQEKHDLLLVRSNFLQVAGSFRGNLVLPTGMVSFEKLAGVTEDQDTLW